MEKVLLGNTGIRASRLCFGTGPLGYQKASLSSEEGGRILKRALDLGVNFWDTSDDYDTHRHVREGLKGVDRAQVVLTTKTYAREPEEARRSLENSLRELGTDYVDFFLLHAVDSLDDFNDRIGILDELLKAKAEGLIRAVGISTHHVRVAQAIPDHPDLEYALLVCNYNAFNMMEGTLDEQLEAIRRSFLAGKGICLMKVLAAGRLADSYIAAMSFALNFPYGHSVMLGIRSIEELEMAVSFIERHEADRALLTVR